jgi:hypothetical protein
MTSNEMPQIGPAASPKQQYLIMSLAALALILLVLLHWGMGEWSFVPVLIGLLGVLLRWRITPLLTLILLGSVLLAGDLTDQPPLRRDLSRGFDLSAWLLCGAALALCAAQYRIQGMTDFLFQDPTRRPKPRVSPTPRPKTDPPCRSPELVSPSEIGWLTLSLPIWAFLAQLGWRKLPAGEQFTELTTSSSRGIALVWLLVMGVLVVAALLSYVGQRRLRQMQARLFLQDVLWQETGGEQRALNRWLTRAKQRPPRQDGLPKKKGWSRFSASRARK